MIPLGAPIVELGPSSASNSSIVGGFKAVFNWKPRTTTTVTVSLLWRWEPIRGPYVRLCGMILVSSLCLRLWCDHNGKLPRVSEMKDGPR